MAILRVLRRRIPLLGVGARLLDGTMHDRILRAGMGSGLLAELVKELGRSGLPKNLNLNEETP